MRRSGFLAIVALSSLSLAIAAACSDSDDGTPAVSDDAGGSDGAIDQGVATEAGNADAGADRWAPCSSRPTPDAAHLCADFDYSSPVESFWTTTAKTGDAIFEGTTAASSPPRALRVHAGTDAGEVARAQLIWQTSLTSKTRVVTSFDLHLDGHQGTDSVQFFALQLDNAECVTQAPFKTRTFDLLIGGGKVSLGVRGLSACSDAGTDYATSTVTNDLGALEATGFAHVTFEIAKGACAGESGAASVRATVNGTTICKSVALDPFTVSTKISALLGVFAAGETISQNNFIYDNVTVDSE